MRSRIVNFRADEALIAALRQKAGRDGVSLSDVIREAIEDKMEAEAAGNPYHHLRAAASGDLEALRALVEMAGQIVVETRDLVAAVEGLTFARMAAARGDIGDEGQLLGLLALAEALVADAPEWSEYRDQLCGEALAVVSRLADAGWDDADLALPSLTKESSARAVEFAREIRERMTAI